MRTVTFPMLALNRSGGVRIVAALANGLAERGVAVTVLAPSYAAVPPVPLGDSVQLRVIEPARDSKVAYMGRLVTEIRRARGVVVATGYLTPSLYFAADPPDARMVSLIQGREIESHVRLGERPAWMKPGLAALGRLGYRIPGYRIAVSRFVADGVGRGRVDEVIHPGIRREFIEAIPSDGRPRPRSGNKLTVGMFAVEGATKGTHHAIAALEALHASGAEVAPVVYDVDYPADHIPDFVARYSTLARDPAQRTVAAFLRRCDVFVLPSLVEGFPLPPLEAMACGAAAVITDCGGMRDYAVDGRNALIVPPADARAIARAVARLAADEALRARLVRAGYETAARFPEERFVTRCSASIMRLLG